MATTPPGWHPDQNSPDDTERYWDGEKWTDARRPRRSSRKWMVVTTAAIAVLLAVGTATALLLTRGDDESPASFTDDDPPASAAPASMESLCSAIADDRPNLPRGGASTVDGSQPAWKSYATHLEALAGTEYANQAWIQEVVHSSRLMAGATFETYVEAEAAVDGAFADGREGCESFGVLTHEKPPASRS